MNTTYELFEKQLLNKKIEYNDLRGKLRKLRILPKMQENIAQSMLHENMREKHIIYKCDQCNFSSSSDFGLKIHHSKIHPIIDLPETDKDTLQTSFNCDFCALIFDDENKLKTHITEVYE